MGTKHIRHLVTELAARLSDRDFLRKAGISRRTMQEIFVRDKWEEALESLFPIREEIIALAETEKLTAHANSIRTRFEAGGARGEGA